MIYEINEDKLTLYRIKLNKNKLKSIKRKIIFKYGTSYQNLKSLNRENFRMYANMYQEEITPIVIRKRYNGNKELIEKTFYQINNPPLAVVLIKILKNPNLNLQLLAPFIEKYNNMVCCSDSEELESRFNDCELEEAYETYLKTKSEMGDNPDGVDKLFHDYISSMKEEKMVDKEISNDEVEELEARFNDCELEEAFETYLETLEKMDSKEVEEVRSGKQFLKAVGIDLEENKKYIGINYLPNILENIGLTKVHESTFVDFEDLNNQLQEQGIYGGFKITSEVCQKILIK